MRKNTSYISPAFVLHNFNEEGWLMAASDYHPQASFFEEDAWDTGEELDF